LSKTIWRIERSDTAPLLLILFLPILAALPALVGLYNANPLLYIGSLAERYVPGSRGIPYADPNNGFTTQALGYRAALDWLHGIVPWWNYFSGVGLPLAAEYQPAAFFPATLILLLPHGMLLQHILLQIAAGLGTYGLLRQLGLGRLAAVTGGLLFAFNGALAWFDHAPALPVPFLPWMLWGIERARAKAALLLPGGWRMFAVALGMSLLAGFPETAYLGGLLAFAWALLRLRESSGFPMAYCSRVALGGLVGIALAAPQILAFFAFLPHAYLAAHDGTFAHIALEPPAALPTLFFPYFYGPIAGYSREWDRLGPIWGSMGGYISLITIVVALYGAMLRRTCLNGLLLAWLSTALAKSFGLPVFTDLWNLVPGVGQAAFDRYAVPTWELAFVILAAQALDEITMRKQDHPPYRRAILVLSWILFAVGAGYAASLWPQLRQSVPLQRWATAGTLWAACTIGVFTVALMRYRPIRTAKAIASILIVDSVLMFFIPTLSNPRSADIDAKAVAFLQRNLGLQRFYSLGPIQANYGAYFGIASINHNYLPVNRQWINWVRANLDAYADPIVFNGNYPRPGAPDAPTQRDELIRNLANYEWIGVKYVVAPTGDDPFISTVSSKTDAASLAPLRMDAGSVATGTLPPGTTSRQVTVSRVGVSIGNYNNKSNGVLAVEVCVNGLCASGQRGLAGSADNSMFYIALGRSLTIEPGSVVRYRFAYSGGNQALVLWMAGTPDPALDQRLTGPAGAEPHRGLQIRLQIEDGSAPLARQVYSDRIMAIYELAAPHPYFETFGQSCRLSPHDREQVIADCAAPSTLLRRELFFPGWAAKINGAPTPIAEHRGLFQSVALPAGKSTIVFSYEPPHMIWAWLAMFAALGALIASATNRFRMKGNVHEAA
jgi:hypothetical protein